MKLIRIVLLMAIMTVSYNTLSAQSSLYRKYLCEDDLLGGKPSGSNSVIEILWVDDVVKEILLTSAKDGSFEKYWLKEQVGGKIKNCQEYILHDINGVYWYFKFCNPSSSKPSLFMTRAKFGNGSWQAHTDDLSMGWLFKNLTRVLD